jgi:hypothetical protein
VQVKEISTGLAMSAWKQVEPWKLIRPNKISTMLIPILSTLTKRILAGIVATSSSFQNMNSVIGMKSWAW